MVDESPLVISAERGKGRGIRAGRRFIEDEVLERAPVVVVTAEDWPAVAGTDVFRFCFAWGRRGEQGAIALGRGSLINHSYSPNAFARPLARERIMEFVALRDIEAGEEITINYNGDPDARDPVGFPVRG
jgi:hypothetical protein